MYQCLKSWDPVTLSAGAFAANVARRVLKLREDDSRPRQLKIAEKGKLLAAVLTTAGHRLLFDVFKGGLQPEHLAHGTRLLARTLRLASLVCLWFTRNGSVWQPAGFPGGGPEGFMPPAFTKLSGFGGKEQLPDSGDDDDDVQPEEPYHGFNATTCSAGVSSADWVFKTWLGEGEEKWKELLFQHRGWRLGPAPQMEETELELRSLACMEDLAAALRWMGADSLVEDPFVMAAVRTLTATLMQSRLWSTGGLAEVLSFCGHAKEDSLPRMRLSPPFDKADQLFNDHGHTASAAVRQTFDTLEGANCTLPEIPSMEHTVVAAGLGHYLRPKSEPSYSSGCFVSHVKAMGQLAGLLLALPEECKVVTWKSLLVPPSRNFLVVGPPGEGTRRFGRGQPYYLN